MGGGYICLNFKIIIMKTKLNFIVLLILMLTSLNAVRAQTPYPLYNNAPCDVILVYEVWDSGCSVCQWGQITVPAFSSVNLPVCAGWIEVCINIVDIGGDVPPSNHTSLGNCHVMTPYGQTGTTSTTASCPGYSWSASQGTSSWTFN